MNTLKLSLALLASIFIGSAQAENTLVDVVNLAKLFTGPIAYGVSNQVLTRNVGDADLRSTIDACIGLTANSIKNKLTNDKEKDESTEKKMIGVAREAVKPLVVLGTIKFGLPFLNKLFEYVHMPQMARTENVSAITAQKIVLFYVGISQVLGFLQEGKLFNNGKGKGN